MRTQNIHFHRRVHGARFIAAQLGTLVACVFGVLTNAHAEGTSVGVDSADLSGAPGGDSNESAFLLGAKVGAIVPLNGFGVFAEGGIQAGYVFGGFERRMAALLDVSYTVPSTEGTETDDRVASAEYSWTVTQKQLVFQPTFLYRFTGGDLVPFAGLGPRLYLLETIGEGELDGQALLETHEKSMKFGVGVPFGAEYLLGPGGLFLEGLFEWGPLDHRITGDGSLMGLNFSLGYRGYL